MLLRTYRSKFREHAGNQFAAIPFNSLQLFFYIACLSAPLCWCFARVILYLYLIHSLKASHSTPAQHSTFWLFGWLLTVDSFMHHDQCTNITLMLSDYLISYSCLFLHCIALMQQLQLGRPEPKSSKRKRSTHPQVNIVSSVAVVYTSCHLAVRLLLSTDMRTAINSWSKCSQSQILHLQGNGILHQSICTNPYILWLTKLAASSGQNVLVASWGNACKMNNILFSQVYFLFNNKNCSILKMKRHQAYLPNKKIVHFCHFNKLPHLFCFWW